MRTIYNLTRGTQPGYILKNAHSLAFYNIGPGCCSKTAEKITYPGENTVPLKDELVLKKRGRKTA